jgi:hypothetical protein
LRDVPRKIEAQYGEVTRVWVTPPLRCPRSAILHSAAASIVDGIFEVTVSTAESFLD